MSDKTQFLTMNQTAKRLGVARQWVYHLVSQGRLRCVSRSPMRLSLDEVQRYQDLLALDTNYDHDEWCTYPEAIELTNLSRTQLRTYINRGLIEIRRPKSRYLLRRRSVENLLPR